jgi:hypothetical protein
LKSSVDDEEFDYRRRKTLRYGSGIVGSMFEHEEEYYQEYARRESERVYIQLQKEIEKETDEYTKTMLEMNLMELKLVQLQHECTSLQEEQYELQSENYVLKHVLDEMSCEDEDAPPAKNAKSPTVPIVTAGHRKFKTNKSDQLWFDDESFKFRRQKDSPDFYDYDAVTAALL